jgi:ABC-type Fe3+/spermidine/putrescine transport system ATPase subunit
MAIDGRVMNDVSPKVRDIAMRLQKDAFFPHMTVRNDMAFTGATVVSVTRPRRIGLWRHEPARSFCGD